MGLKISDSRGDLIRHGWGFFGSFPRGGREPIHLCLLNEAWAEIAIPTLRGLCPQLKVIYIYIYI